MSEQGRSWGKTREKVLARDDHACRFCGMSEAEHTAEYDRGLHAHHIIPRRDGGPDRTYNLITVCQSCHRTLESTHAEAVAQMRKREDYKRDLEGVNHVFSEWFATHDDMNRQLRHFIETHPVFSREVGARQMNGDVEVRELRRATALGDDCRIESELGFAAAYGFKEGVLAVVSALDGHTEVPFEEV